MDPALYKAAMDGNINALDQYLHQLEAQVTPNNDTALHVAAQFGREEFVKKILETCPFMARHRPNITDDSALHVAVREGYVHIAKAILKCGKRLGRELESGGGVTKELLRATNKVGDTALHIAVRRKKASVEMVRLLIQEDLEFQHLPNNAKETPLYIAAERGYAEVMVECLKNRTCLAIGGPCGRTALHAAVISRNQSVECTQLLLDAGHKYGIDLIKVKDAFGWTPLHYAARNGYSNIVALILKVDKSAAYIGSNDNNTPLHLAATAGEQNVMKELLSYSPDCWGIVNKKGHNVLHVAVDVEQEDVITFISDLPIFRFLINQQDKDGNTPLHLLAEKKKLHRLLLHELADGAIFNNQNLKPWDLFRKEENPHYSGRRNIIEDDFNTIKNFPNSAMELRKARQQNLKEYKEIMKKMGETHLIVATLVTTIAFTAAFAIPGGYDGNPGSNQGLAILVKTTAFKIFVIANSIALVSSLTSVIIYIVVSFCYYSNPMEQDDGDIDQEEKIAVRYTLALLLVMIAIGAMILAFVTGTYVILAHSLALAISTVTIGCLSFITYVREVRKILLAVKSLGFFEDVCYLLS